MVPRSWFNGGMNNNDAPQPDPFVHLPHLRERFIAPQASKARVTPEVLAQWDQAALERGTEMPWRLPDEEREASRQAFMASIDTTQDVWVFGYGSLMWDPAIHFVEARAAALNDHQRLFNYRVIGGRGTPEQPGLVLSLMPQAGVCCDGLVFRIAAHMVEQETQVLWRREMIRGGYLPSLLAVDTPQGAVQALVFVARADNPSYVHDLSLDETADIVATASGHLGHNRDYLLQLAEQLQALDLADPYISDLVQRVRQRV